MFGILLPVGTLLVKAQTFVLHKGGKFTRRETNPIKLKAAICFKTVTMSSLFQTLSYITGLSPEYYISFKSLSELRERECTALFPVTSMHLKMNALN